MVTTSKQQTITAKRLTLTVGAWTNEVLSHLGMQLSLEIWKVHWGHYYVHPEVQHRLPQWYKFCKLRPESWDEGLYYGFPPENAEPIVKASRLLLDGTSSQHNGCWLQCGLFSADGSMVACHHSIHVFAWETQLVVWVRADDACKVLCCVHFSSCMTCMAVVCRTCA